MNIKLSDFQALCRVCLKQNKVYLNIFSSLYPKHNVFCSEMLSECTVMKPSKDDRLPSQICKDCFKQLKRTYEFTLLCSSSDEKLKNILSGLENCNTSQNDSTIKNEVDPQNLYNGNEICNVKDENDSKPEVTNENDLKLNEETDFEQDLKLEPTCDNDENDNWNDEDDNLLIQYKETKEDNDDVPIKKKRGRKKRVYSNGQQTLSSSKLPHQCDVCGKILSSKSNLNSHKIIHTDLRPFKCAECPATFRCYSGLFQHKRLHTGETPYHCEYCPKQFRKKTTLVQHIRVHTGEKLYDCKICFKSFIQSAQLAIHMKRHSGDKTFLCQDCGKGFIIKADLRVHQRVHNGEKPYSCHLCDKTFATSGNLSIHVRIHNREFRYTCKFCNRGFITCSSYNVHVKRHSGQRDYSCECGKKFYTSSALKQHKVVHTGEKRYQCKICDRKFTQTSHLSRHFRKDHAKPNDPLPTSDHYKIILPAKNPGVAIFDLEKPPNVTVKCDS